MAEALERLGWSVAPPSSGQDYARADCVSSGS
jgi:hypothetical protein